MMVMMIISGDGDDDDGPGVDDNDWVGSSTFTILLFCRPRENGAPDLTSVSH